ncbi:hypothetical protein HZS61_009221 [Fusarium oxysporum f. sp. conglutinans]|uniref:Transcription factor domain-containing protein n=1 Tax=Fusarium oxysporum f. sp. conglutinans TaxID=100902 RepID=A0A8H6GYX4_FUSOX|nr:hypothetical protein HZS61_009221 [Fusarium oxysporum f. sp. conglutinans]
MLSETSSWSPANPEPPSDLLTDFVNAYREKIYFQPLPLFDPKRLQLKTGTLPQYLRWSFLALSLHYTSHNFYYGLEAKAIEYYTTSARSVVVDMAAEGLVKLEVMQALCLLALCDHIAGKSSRAWMMIGMAAKLESLRLSDSKASGSRQSDDAVSRCHWSIAILESTFTPHCNTLFEVAHAPNYPKSVPRPTTLHGMKTYCADLTDAYEANVQDVGIVATCLGYISVWGSIISYLRDIRNGANEYPWLATSRHNQLTVKLYELENITSHRHLIRNAPFPDQPPSELSENREYWAPWVLFQVLMHATQAILNNPFVQLVALRRAGRNFQPRSFLQNTVDQALFHAEWVSRLVRMCVDRQFEVNDPLVGQAVAGCVSILWIFQFARDRKVSEKAKENLGICETFLEHLSRKWPHIAEKVEILRTLNIKVKKKRQSPQDDESSSATIQFEPDMMWELLDPAIGLPGRHTYVTQQGYDAALVEAQIFNHTRQLREAGYNVRAVWRGPEIPGNEMSRYMKDVHWNVAGIGFGVRGSQISDVITLFEGQ